jgi:predicted DNA-binding transcriptional regulator YafY
MEQLSLFSLFKELITERVERRRIVDAIQNRKLISFYYIGDTVNVRGYRTVEPVAFGLSKANNPVIRAWQRDGVSDHPDEVPGWRLFRTDRIIQWSVLRNQSFNEQRPGFNPRGDESMNQIYIIAQFPGRNEPNDDLTDDFGGNF